MSDDLKGYCDEYEPDHPQVEALSAFYNAIEQADGAALAAALRKFATLERDEIRTLANLLDAADPTQAFPAKLELSRLKEGRPRDDANPQLSVWISVKKAMKEHNCNATAAFQFVASSTGTRWSTVKTYYYKHAAERAKLMAKRKHELI